MRFLHRLLGLPRMLATHTALWLVTAVLVSVVVASTTAAPKVQEVALIGKLEKGGRFFPGELHVKKGIPVRIYLTSTDYAHTLDIEEFNASVVFEKEKLTVVEFVPTKVGRFTIACTYHQPQMNGTLVVEP